MDIFWPWLCSCGKFHHIVFVCVCILLAMKKIRHVYGTNICVCLQFSADPNKNVYPGNLNVVS